MAVPWLQLVKLVPSIVDVSRELLRRTKTTPPPPGAAMAPQTDEQLLARIAALEENERQQAELVSQMAEQQAVVARALAALHRQLTWLTIGLGVSLLIALIALAFALR
jgi:hypothetical protein